jgi:activator of HSP90 ATPase
MILNIIRPHVSMALTPIEGVNQFPMNPGPSAPINSRRRALASIAAALAAAPLVRAQQPSMAERPSTEANKARTTIHYELEFKPSPQQLYQAVLDQKQFTAFSGLPATIDPTPGGAFSMFGGLIVGRTIELVANQRIVQAWRPTHWDPGVYSIVHFEFKPRAAETTLVFDHTGFPAGEFDHLDWGWHNHYWEPLKKFFA